MTFDFKKSRKPSISKNNNGTKHAKTIKTSKKNIVFSLRSSPGVKYNFTEFSPSPTVMTSKRVPILELKDIIHGFR